MAGQLKMGEAKIDGDAALFLLGQAIGIVTRERLHQRALAVVDVTGRGEDGVAGVHYFTDSRLNSKVAFTGTDLPFTSRCGPKK